MASCDSSDEGDLVGGDGGALFYKPLVPFMLEKAMATHSSVLAWRIPGMREPGGLPSLGSHRVELD